MYKYDAVNLTFISNDIKQPMLHKFQISIRLTSREVNGIKITVDMNSKLQTEIVNINGTGHIFEEKSLQDPFSVLILHFSYISLAETKDLE